ncbi:hypothetical protein HP2P_4230 [Hydrangea phyllody phytoplasma]|uniref:Mobilization protein n=2 Tax=Candidatus Phytoplasma TaxID=33926 RepID=A0ABQ5PTJ3_9MOLU|nr:hypothetical protein RHYP_1860 [Rhus yellows phytoplasma]GLH62016.1 hypothetical protein HP2P_4230 [Hydrangea phyllody phytoplasma]
MAKDLFHNEDGTPKMMSKETYDSICSHIDREKTKLAEDYNAHVKKREEYKASQQPENLQKETIKLQEGNRQIQEGEKNAKKTALADINEFSKITKELTRAHNATKPGNLVYKQTDLEQQLEQKNEEIENAKEELKQKNPSYARAQQRSKEKRYAKFYQPIINK